MEIKDGDIFRWSYRDPVDHSRYPYHCCSQIAVVKNGVLRDTYWHGGSDGRSLGKYDFSAYDLVYIGNLADLDRTDEWLEDYYDDADIVNLSHQNSTRGNFYLRKGSKRSAAKMLETARYKLERAQSDEQMAAHRATECRKAIAKIEAGEIEGLHL